MFLSDAYKKKLYGKNINDRCYDILPYDTKISGDHNKLGFYGFTSCKKNGFTLTPALVFDEIIYIPTVIYHKQDNRKDTVYIVQLAEYGYNEHDLVVKTYASDSICYWLQPVREEEGLRIMHIDGENIDRKAYHWICPMGNKAFYAVILWIILLVMIPVSALAELYFVVALFVKEDE